MPTADDTDNNSRVTNAIILAAVKTLNEKVGTILEEINHIDTRQRNDHDRLIGACKQAETNAAEISTLRSVNRVWDFLNSLGIAVGTWFGVNN